LKKLSADKMFGIPIQTPSGNNTTVLEMLGGFPLFLLVGAIAIGIAAVVLRNYRFNIAAACALASIGFFGFGTTAWRLFIYNRSIIHGGGIDPSQTLSDFSIAWMPSGVVLPACGFGFMLLSLSCLLTKGLVPKNSNAEQDVPPDA
jgi:hypothetical protein